MGRRKVTEEILVDSIVEEKIEETPIEENIIELEKRSVTLLHLFPFLMSIKNCRFFHIFAS